MSQDVTNSEKELSARQVIAIPHLVSAKSVSETADLIGVNRKTIYRWMDDPISAKSMIGSETPSPTSLATA